MGSFLIALLFGLSIGTWIYTKMARQSGYGNAKSALLGAGVAGLGVFLVLFTLFKFVLGLK